MGFVFVFASVLLTSRCVGLAPLLPSIAGKLNKVAFVYPSGVQSERDLPACPENSACSVIHKRFWLPPIVERLCKCSRRHDCGWTWTPEPDDYTMALDNRSQLKFCERLELPQCAVNEVALRVMMEKGGGEGRTEVTARFRGSGKFSRQARPKNVTAVCNCQGPHYWKLDGNSSRSEEDTDEQNECYLCSELKKCVAAEFCGYVRTDTYSTFYRCSCPDGHLCISRDKSVFEVEEVLYNGQGYKAFCLPVGSSRRGQRHFQP